MEVVAAKYGGMVNEVVGRFTALQAARLVGLPQQTLSYWVRHGIIQPAYRDDSGWVGFRYLFSFQDLVTLRTLRVLREHHVPIKKIQWAAATLQQYFGRPWTTFQLFFYGGEVAFVDPQTDDLVSISQPGQKMAPKFVALEPLRLKMQAKVEDFDRRKPEQIGTFSQDRTIMGGQEVIAGTRIPPSSVYEFHRAGYSVEQILEEYPSLEARDIEAAIAHEEERLAASRKSA
jgi:uncharacterized protein (DUF433 family)/DNA-binding transcriptional MerR regulator